jgi:predicted nucleotidyltransferase
VADARQLAGRLVPELVGEGAVAVVMTGSYARGNATDLSDLDLMVVGDGPAYALDVRDGVLVAQSWASEDAHRARLRSPPEVGSSVLGWREAVVLHDPEGVAAELKRHAVGWGWEQLDPGCDEWVAEELVGFAEEVLKLAAALHSGHTLTAAVQRDLLALRLAPILAVHHRLLYGSENVVWEQVGGRMGEEWQRAQAVAFSTGGESLELSCAASLRLFRLAIDCVAALLDDRQSAVVRHALAAAARYA